MVMLTGKNWKSFHDFSMHLCQNYDSKKEINSGLDICYKIAGDDNLGVNKTVTAVINQNKVIRNHEINRKKHHNINDRGDLLHLG